MANDGVFTLRRIARHVSRFKRKDEGVAAIEFAMVATPFFAPTFAILETALVFFGGQVLETATQDASRLLLTGQAQKQNLTAAQFKAQICTGMSTMFDCNAGVRVDVRKATAFGGASLAPPLDANGNVDPNGFGYQPGGPGEIVVVRVVYEWPVLIRTFGLDLSDLPNGNRLMMSTATFRVEPYN